jgi:CDP-diacylglycerol--glycerol-3-phosphate 3-phosphatidyltransferase
VVLANLDLVPLWVAIVFITRGSLVDSIRYSAIKQGQTAFGMIRTSWGRFLVSGRFMRGFYGALKAVTFGWILLIQPWPQLDPASWSAWSGYAYFVSAFLIHASVIVCLARGIPVVLEFILSSDLFAATPRWTKRPG